MRPELSRKNKYWIDRYRYYELKYFCLQYPTWKNLCDSIDGTVLYSYHNPCISETNTINDSTCDKAYVRSIYKDKIKMIENAALSADPHISNYILMGVTKGYSYNYLKSRLEIPCGKDLYYDRYRRFFWLLDIELKLYLERGLYLWVKTFLKLLVY